MASSKSTPSENFPLTQPDDKWSIGDDFNGLSSKADVSIAQLRGLIASLQTQVNGKVDKP